MRSAQKVKAIRTFATWQMLAALGGATLFAILGLLSPSPAFAWVFGIAVANAITCAITLWLISRGSWQLASYLFIATDVISIAAAAPVVGSTSNAPALYLWPTLTAAMLLGRRAGITTGLAAFASFVATFGLEVSGRIAPLFDAGINVYIGGFSLVLALLLGIIVADTYRRNNDYALDTAETEAEANKAKNTQLETTFEREARAKQDALLLAARLDELSREQEDTAASAATGITQVTSQAAEGAAAAAQIAVSAQSVRQSGEQITQQMDALEGQNGQNNVRLEQVLQSGQRTQTTAKEMVSSTKRMNGVLALLTEVAAEVQMLGLNATIEATGAGEHGRRFRVIAGEISRLGERVNSGVDEAGSIISSVQGGAASILTAANITVANIGATLSASADFVQQLTAVSAAAEAAAQEGFSISASTEQQRRSADGVAEGAERVSQVATQSANTSRALTEYAATLRQIIAGLTPSQPPNRRDSPAGPSQRGLARIVATPTA